MASETRPGEGELHSVTGENDNTAEEGDASLPTICFVCQRPISEDEEQLPRGEPAHPACAEERREALSRSNSDEN